MKKVFTNSYEENVVCVHSKDKISKYCVLHRFLKTIRPMTEKQFFALTVSKEWSCFQHVTWPF